MDQTTTQHMLDVQQNADALTEVYEAVTNQRLYTSVIRIGLGARDFFQCATVELPDHTFNLSEIDAEMIAASEMVAYAEIDADEEWTLRQVQEFILAQSVLTAQL